MTSIDALRGSEADAWQVELATEADAAGDHDGTITVAELDALLGAAPDGSGALPAGPTGLQLPTAVGVNVRSSATAQNLAMLRSRIAERTGEPDLLRARGPGLTLLHTYARTVFDSEHRLPRVVSYVLAASDLREDGPERKNAFRADQTLPVDARAANADYVRSGFDKGHMRPAEDSPNAEAMRESFLLSNMAPQTPALNEHVWAQLEKAIRDVVRASQGEAIVFTGNLFLDAKGDPLPPSAIRWIGRNGQARVAVPTHCFKVAMIRQPNGQLTMIGFVVPNTADLPTKNVDIRPLLQSSRRSIAEIERLSGETFFDDLPDAIERPMEADSDACVALPAGTDLQAVSLIFPTGCHVASWTLPSPPQQAPTAAPAVDPLALELEQWLKRLGPQ